MNDFKPQSSAKVEMDSQVLYLSALYASQYPETYRRLTDILNKHNVPFDFLKGTKDAISVYLNYLEVGNLIVLPIFGVSGNCCNEALAKLKQVFPDKTIETINYNDVALTEAILNCTTRVIRK